MFRDASVAFLHEGTFELFADERCAAELERVLAYPKIAADVSAVMAKFRARVTLIEAAATPLPRCEDPDDQKFLEVAAAAGADFLISKDAALLVLDRRKLSFRIVGPKEAGTLLAG